MILFREKDYLRFRPKLTEWRYIISEQEKADLEAAGISTERFSTYKKVFVGHAPAGGTS